MKNVKLEIRAENLADQAEDIRAVINELIEEVTLKEEIIENLESKIDDLESEIEKLNR